MAYSRPLPAGGGSLLIAWQLKGKRVLIVGGGEVAAGRIESVLAADPFITLVSPSDGLHPQTRSLIEASDRITFHDRLFHANDLAHVDMVLTAIDDAERSHEIVELCRASRIPVNAADIPPLCDFYFGSQIRRGPLQVMVSTNGNGPKLANIIRRRIEDSIPLNVGDAIIQVGILRTKLRERAPGIGGDLGRNRMQWMSSVCTKWDMDDLALLDEDAMDKLLDDGWERDRRVPTPQELGMKSKYSALTSHSPTSLLPAVVGFLLGSVLSTSFFLLRRR